jgi:hypothetical protein
MISGIRARRFAIVTKANYWPPTNTSSIIELPGGRKKMFIFNGKSDRNGSHQPIMCIASRGNERLAFFDAEEVTELKRVIDRLDEYLTIWEKASEINRIKRDEIERRTHALDDRIGVEL